MPTVLTPNNSPFSSLVQSKSKKDLAYDFLKNKIVLNEFPEGTVLVERQLCELMDASRTPIREALRRLEQEHLIADTGKGSVVLGITAEDLVDIMDIRCKIEGLASYYAAKNAAPVLEIPVSAWRTTSNETR